MTFTSPSYDDLDGKVVIVTGGGSGIGLAIAEAFARNRARLMIIDIDGEVAQRSCALLKRHSPDCEILISAASVTDEVAVQEAFALCQRSFGRIDILINNAGIAVNKPALDLSLEEWRRGIDVNLTGVFLCAREAARHMILQEAGNIVNIASMYGIVAAPHRSAYCASKAAVVSLTKSLAVEWAPHNIRVNAIGPGYTHTPFVDELRRNNKLDLDALCHRTPLGRLGTPEEMAQIVLFLASQGSAFITGHTLVADGGWTANGYM